MADATETPAAVPPVPDVGEAAEVDAEVLPNQDLHDEIADKRAYLASVRAGHQDTAAEQAAEFEKRQLERESTRLDDEIAAAEAAADHQANAVMPGEELDTTDSNLSARRNARRRKRAGE